MKALTKQKYNSDRILTPKDQATKDFYFKIYEEYIMGHITEKQLGEKYNKNFATVSRIIKWVTFQIGEPDPDVQIRSLIDSLKLRQQEIDMEIQKAETVEDKVKLWRELREIDTLSARVQGLLSPVTIDMSDRRQVNVTMNKLERRTGSEERDKC